MNKINLLLVLFFSITRLSFGQQAVQLAYKPKGFDKVKVTNDILYKTYDTDKKLRFDFYKAEGAKKTGSPITIIMNGFGDPAQKNNPGAMQWAKAIAADGIACVTFESHIADVEKDFDDLYQFLIQNKEAYQWNGKCIIMQYSGNVSRGMPIVTNQNRTGINAVVTYYGLGEIKNFRQDLPVFFVRAGMDNPPFNRRIDSMLAKVIYQNLPWTIVNHHGGTHPFEFNENDEPSVSIIKQTLEFMHTAIEDPYAKGIQDRIDIIAAGTAVYQKDWKNAITAYEKVILKDTSSPETFMRLGDSYFGDQAYQKAVGAYEKSLQLGNWRLRDISIPASTAAARLKDVPVTLKWLARLSKAPGGKQFITTSSEFSFLQDNEEFKQLVK